MKTLDSIDHAFLPNLCHTVPSMDFWLSCYPSSQVVLQGLLPWPVPGNPIFAEAQYRYLYQVLQLPPAVLLTDP